MLKHIIKRELLDNLMSLRFSLTLILMVTVMSASAILFLSDHKEAVSTYQVNLQENRRRMEGLIRSGIMPWTMQRIMSFELQWVYKKPSDFSFLADGHDKDLPNTFTVNMFEINGPSTRLRMNPLLRQFESLDWSLVIGVIMSFAAIVLTFDLISGDRERGTLKLSISNSIPRATIMLGKYIGALVSLLIPLLGGMLLSVIIIAISGIIPMDRAAWARIAIAASFSLLYVTGFVSLGMFVSSITRESATSLIVLLLSWAMLVVVIPGVGGVIVSRFVPSPNLHQAGQDARNAEEQTRDEYLARHPELEYLERRWGDARNMAGPLSAAEASMEVWNRYRDTLVSRVRVGQNATRVSPLGLYRHAIEALAGTGLGHHESFMKQVRQYREVFKRTLMGKYPFDPHRDYGGQYYMEWRKVMDNLEFGLSDIPEFHEKPVTIQEGTKVAVWDVLFLFLFSLLFFMGSVVAFLRYDVR